MGTVAVLLIGSGAIFILWLLALLVTLSQVRVDHTVVEANGINAESARSSAVVLNILCLIGPLLSACSLATIFLLPIMLIGGVWLRQKPRRLNRESGMCLLLGSLLTTIALALVVFVGVIRH